MVFCLKQGIVMNNVFLKQGSVMNNFCLKHGEGLKAPGAHLYPNIPWVPSPGDDSSQMFPL